MKVDKFRPILLCGMLLLLAASAAPVKAEAPAAPTALIADPVGEGAVIPGELVVMLKPGTSAEEASRLGASLGGSLASYDGASGLALYVIAGNNSAEAAAFSANQALDASDQVLLAEPNYIYSIGPLGEISIEPPARPETLTRMVRDLQTGEQRLAGLPVPSMEQLNETQSTSWNNDPVWNWGWYAIDGDIIWKNTTLGYEVAVLDTGVDNTHPDLVAKVTQGRDFVNNDLVSMDDNGHGTHVAGIIAATVNNKLGIAGIGNAKIYAVKVLGADGWGTSYEIAQGLIAASNRSTVRVINMSLGGPYSSVMEQAVSYAVSKGKLLVVAAGNSNAMLDCETYATYPACFRAYAPFEDNIIVVGATGIDLNDNGYISWADLDYDDYYETNEQVCQGGWAWYDEYDGLTVDHYSNYGTYVDIAAPGTWIQSTVPITPVNGGWNSKAYPYASQSGTSMASPFVAGVAARTWARNPSFTAGYLKSWLLDASWDAGGGIDLDCWEIGSTNIPFLSAAGAMDMVALNGSVSNADTGAPIPGASVQARRGATTVASDLICADPYCDYFTVRSIPRTGAPLDMWVSHAGFTSSYQKYIGNWVFPSAGMWWATSFFLPAKSTRWNFVASWYDYWGYDLDTYLFLPPNTPSVHPDSYATTYYPAWIGPREPEGGVSISDWGPGTLVDAPRVRMMLDSMWTLNFPADAIALQKNGSGVPFYPGSYTFVVANNWDDYLGDGVTPVGQVWGACAWVWNAGVIKYQSCAENIYGSYTDPDPYWVVGQLNGTTFSPIAAIVNGTTIGSITQGGRVFSADDPARDSVGPIPPAP